MTVRFADSAELALDAAHRVARRFNHDFIGTDHVLLGLLETDASVVRKLVESFQIEYASFVRAIELSMEPTRATPDMGRLPLLRGARQALEFAAEEAQNFACASIGAEHLLLGLLREGEGIAARTLQEHGVDFACACEHLARICGRRRAQSAQVERDVREPIQPPAVAGFSERLQAALQTARGAAERLHHDHIGAEHLLLGLIDEKGSVAVDALELLGLSASLIRDEVEQLFPPVAVDIGGAYLTFTSGAKRALEMTLDEAAAFGGAQVGTEHLLLALVRDERGAAMSVLRRYGRSLDDVRRRIEEALAASGDDGDPRRAVKSR